MKIIRGTDFVEGRWRNGRGRSWDIASDAPFAQAGTFGWRLAIAEIAASGPFSHYEGVDRIFTLIEGEGVRLDFGNGTQLAVTEKFVPHHYACDIPTQCTLLGETARALNLFTSRSSWRAEAEIVELAGNETRVIDAAVLLALRGSVICDGHALHQGDAAVVQESGPVKVQSNDGLLYVARLHRRA